MQQCRPKNGWRYLVWAVLASQQKSDHSPEIANWPLRRVGSAARRADLRPPLDNCGAQVCCLCCGHDRRRPFLSGTLLHLLDEVGFNEQPRAASNAEWAGESVVAPRTDFVLSTLPSNAGSPRSCGAPACHRAATVATSGYGRPRAVPCNHGCGLKPGRDLAQGHFLRISRLDSRA